jgi:DNA-binding NarL/FixJ family response regulator
MKSLVEDSREAVDILESLTKDKAEDLCVNKRSVLKRVALDLLAICRSPKRLGGQVTEPQGNTIPLSARETEVAEGIANGLTDGEIAAVLGISTRTVNTHRDRVLRKLNLRSRSSVASWAAKNLAAAQILLSIEPPYWLSGLL